MSRSKFLRYTTAIAVSLVALSTANQANAQCTPANTTGNDTITCNGTQNGTFSFGISDFGGGDDLTNNGTIDGGAASALVINSTLSGIGGASFGGSLTNVPAGVITSDSADATVRISFSNIFNQVDNQNLIENMGGGAAISFDASSSSADITGGINNSGIIRGAIGFEIGNILTDSTVSITGGINNSGTIEGTGGTAILLGDEVDGLVPININGGQIIGDVIDNNPDSGFSPVTIIGSGFNTAGDFTVSSLTVNAGQEFRISGDNTFTTQTATFGAGSTINFGVNAAGDGGLLDVATAGINLTGVTIGAEVDPAADGVLMDGQEIQIATGTAALIGTDGNAGQALTAVTDSSLLFDFAIADGGQGDITGSGDANSLFFLVSQTASAGGSAVTSNANSAGATINALMGAGNTELDAILANVAATSTPEELESILQAVLPQIDRGGFAITQNVSSNTIRLVSDRLTTIRGDGGAGSGISSGDITENLQGWGQVFGQAIDQDERDGVAGFDADTFGFTFGVDTEALSDNGTIGLAFTYANTDVDSDSVNNTQTDIDSFAVQLYGDYDLTDQTNLVASLGYTYGDNETTRFNVGGVGGLTANSDYSSNQIEARLIGVHNYDLPQLNGIKLSSRVQAHYIYYEVEDIDETGAGGANLNIDSDALNVLEFGVGVDARKDYVQANGAIFSPEVSVGYRYDVIGDAINTTSTFSGGGPSFQSEGADPAQGTLNLGLGLGYTTPDNWEFTASYDYETKSDFNSHSGLIRAAYKF